MCGIIGYVGDREITPVLLAGLKRMEYRGYDSSGVAILGPTGITLRKSIGKISKLEEDISSNKIPGWLGIGHTRWATHGVPSTLNAHPHRDDNGELALIHNGIIENYLSLKNDLIKKGHEFISETDTEVLLHLIQDFYNGSGLESAIRKALTLVRGTYGIALISRAEPDRIVVARAGSPIILGKGKNENFIASDMSAFIEYTNDVIFLNDGEMATITKDKIYHCGIDNSPIQSKVEKISLSVCQG